MFTELETRITRLTDLFLSGEDGMSQVIAEIGELGIHGDMFVREQFRSSSYIHRITSRDRTMEEIASKLLDGKYEWELMSFIGEDSRIFIRCRYGEE